MVYLETLHYVNIQNSRVDRGKYNGCHRAGFRRGDYIVCSMVRPVLFKHVINHWFTFCT